MLKKDIIFKILYIIVGPLSNALFSTKPLLPTSGVCSDWPADPMHCDWPNTTSTRGIEINRSIDALQTWTILHRCSNTGVFKLFCQPNPFDLNYLFEVPTEILSKYFNNLMAHLHV